MKRKLWFCHLSLIYIARPDSSFRRRTDGKTKENGVVVEFECLLKL
ncbi:hypothetical protein [Prevotella sp. HUN102]|nr:hypothetical protein [Prevotella sp. HUN102]